MVSDKDFANTGKKWAKNLEITKPDEVDKDVYTDFNNRN